MTTLLTGATGFVGSAILRILVQRGFNVRVLVRPNGDRQNLQGINCEIAEGDLNDNSSLDSALKGCDILFHVAADYRLWVKDPAELYRTNSDATISLFRSAKLAGVTRIVYTSSVATLGNNLDGSPADEETPVNLTDMVGDYKRSKFLAEKAVSDLIRDEGLPVVIVNPSTPVGPRDVKPTPTGRVIVEAAAGRMPAYVNTGLNVAHVDDVAIGHLLALEKGKIGERYILGGENLSFQEILEQIAILVGRRRPLICLPRAPLFPFAYVTEWVARFWGLGEPLLTVDSLRMAGKKMYFSSAKAEQQLGYHNRPAIDALRDAVGWFHEQKYLD